MDTTHRGPTPDLDPTDDAEIDDRSLHAALELLERRADPQSESGGGRSETDHEADFHEDDLRETLDALATLAYDAPPVEPPARLRAAILDGVHHLEREPSPVPAPGAPLPFRPAAPSVETSIDVPVDAALRDENAADLTLQRIPTRLARRSERPRVARSLQWLAAAAVLLAVLGAGYLAGSLQATRDDVGSLRSELRATRLQLESARERFEMVTLTARQAYPMTRRVAAGAQAPPTARDAFRDAKGIVYVCGRHEQWLLSLTGLRQPPAGETYRLWFMTASGPVDGGVLDVDEHGDAAAEDLTMPPGTRGFSVSLEPVGAPADAPSHVVLLGDEPVRL